MAWIADHFAPTDITGVSVRACVAGKVLWAGGIIGCMVPPGAISDAHFEFCYPEDLAECGLAVRCGGGGWRYRAL